MLAFSICFFRFVGGEVSSGRAGARRLEDLGIVGATNEPSPVVPSIPRLSGGLQLTCCCASPSFTARSRGAPQVRTTAVPRGFSRRWTQMLRC